MTKGLSTYVCITILIRGPGGKSFWLEYGNASTLLCKERQLFDNVCNKRSGLRNECNGRDVSPTTAVVLRPNLLSWDPEAEYESQGVALCPHLVASRFEREDSVPRPARVTASLKSASTEP